MSPITDPTEEYFKDGLWGWVTNQWKKIVADAAGHLQVDVLTSGLPTGGATATNQTTMITALQLIDDLRNTLNSIAIDEIDVVIDGQNTDVEITQTTPAHLTPGIEGWDGSAWHKLPLIFGYSSQVLERQVHAKVGAGAYTLTFSQVPSGEIRVITSICAWCSTNNPSLVYIDIYQSGTPYYIHRSDYPIANHALNVQSHFYLLEDDRVRIEFRACADGDLLRGYVFGYTIKIAE